MITSACPTVGTIARQIMSASAPDSPTRCGSSKNAVAALTKHGERSDHRDIADVAFQRD